MAKYINADDIEYTKKIFCYGQGWYELDEREETDVEFVLKKEIDEMPAADVRENVRGEWEIMEDADGCKYYRCSACHRFRFHNGAMLKKYRFCPICGAENRLKKQRARI